MKISHGWTTLSWILNRKTPVPVHLSPASAFLLAYRLHYPHRMSWRLLLLWVRYNSLRLILQPFSGRHTLCLRQSHRTFRLQDIYHTQLLAGNQLRKEWLLCHSHNHRGLSQQQRSHRLLRTQLIRSQLEQQNFEMMNSLQQKNQQIKDLSAQLQTGMQAFLQQSMEQMFNRLVPAQTQPPAATSTTPPPHIVSITLVSAIPPAKAEEPMVSAPSQPAPPEVKKGLSKVKGSSAIAQLSIQAVVSQVKVPTTTPSTQPSSLPMAASASRLASPLQAWNKRNTGLMLQLPPSLPLQSQKTLQKLENRRHLLTSLSGNWSKRVGSSCLLLTQQQKRTISWAQHWDVIPFSCNKKSWIDTNLSSSQWWPT